MVLKNMDIGILCESQDLFELSEDSLPSLPISFVGTYPFITYSPIGGRDLKVIAVLAKKFRFLPNLIVMESFDGEANHVRNH